MAKAAAPTTVVRKRKKVDTWKDKGWYEVLAPKMFNEVKVGETISSNPTNLIGRIVEASMKDIIGDFSKQHIKLRFQIEDVKGDKAYTRFKGQSLSREYMRSQIRRKTTRVEGVADVETKDGIRLRVKTIGLAMGRAQTAQEKLVRKIMIDIVRKAAGEAPLEQFIQEVVQGKLSMDMYKASNKIYPLKRIEVRKIQLLEPKRKEAAAATEGPAAPEGPA